MVVRKKAFTLIELIFAIVIVAIVVISLPMMTQATSSNLTSNLETQEAMFQAIVLTKTAIGENNFNDILSAAKTTPTAVTSGTAGLTEYKFNHTYTLLVTSNATFDTVATARKITTTIFKDDGTTLATFVAYIFNY